MDLVIRTAVIYLFVFLITRITGKRELNSLEPFDLIMLVVIGDLIQQGVTQNDLSVTGALLVVSMLALLTLLLSYLSFRVPALRPALRGEPVILVHDGEPITKNLNRQRLTIDEVLAEARGQQIKGLADVKLAVLETSGKMSFIPKQSG